MQRGLRGAVKRTLASVHLLEPARALRDWFRSVSPAGLQHRREMKEFYAQFIREGDLCFDVGANVGNRTEVFLELGARVVAVEPQPSCMKKLQDRHAGNSRVTLAAVALGERDGEGELLIGDTDTVSSMSSEWIERVRDTGRFGENEWTSSVRVPVTTLERLIREHGRPAFIKIDVEGYEAVVLRGLSSRVPALSFEFTPEFLESAVEIVERLGGLGFSRFNYSVGESMRMELSEWIDRDEMVRRLSQLPDPTIFGDVYARS